MSSDYASLSAPVSEAATGPVSELQLQSAPQTARTAPHRHRPARQTNTSFQSPARRPARVSSALVPVVSKLLWLCVCVLLVEASWSRADAASVKNGGHQDTRHGRTHLRSRLSRSAPDFSKLMPNYTPVFPGIPLPHSSVAYGEGFNSRTAKTASPECSPVFFDRESRIASAYTILVASVVSKWQRELRVKIERILMSQRRAVPAPKSVAVVRNLSLDYLVRNHKCHKFELAENRSYIFYLTPSIQSKGPAIVLWPPVPVTLPKVVSILKHLCERMSNSTTTRAPVSQEGSSSSQSAYLTDLRCESM